VPEAFDHVDLAVSDLARSLAFYRGVLAPLGFASENEVGGEQGETIHYLNAQHGSLGLREARSQAHSLPYDRYAVGVHHLCFSAPSRTVVEECAAWLRDHGARIESGPEEYGYRPGYYAVFFRDPDGIKLEIAHLP
jgi:glyoxylase I family protein